MSVQDTDRSWLDDELDNLPGVPKEDDAEKVSDYSQYADDPEEPSETPEQPEQPKQDDGDPEQPKPDDSQSAQGQQADQQGPAQAPTEAPNTQTFKSPIPRNLVKEIDQATGRTTLIDGSVLVSPAALRVYSKGLNAQRTVQEAQQRQQQIEQENQSLRSRMEATEQSLQAVTRSELPATEVGAAIQIFQDLRKNPKETLQKLLTAAQTNGIVLDNGNGSALDPNAVRGIIQKELEPILQPMQQQRQQQEQQQRYEQQKQQFFQNYPDSQTHWEEIEALTKSARASGQNLSPVDIYYRLQSEYQQHGMDWSKPFTDPHNQEVYQRQFGPPSSQPAPPPSRPLPPNTASNATGRQAVPQKKAQLPDPDESIEDILRDVMAQNGYSL